MLIPLAFKRKYVQKSSVNNVFVLTFKESSLSLIVHRYTIICVLSSLMQTKNHESKNYMYIHSEK